MLRSKEAYIDYVDTILMYSLFKDYSDTLLDTKSGSIFLREFQLYPLKANPLNFVEKIILH